MRRARSFFHALRARLRDESGQAMTEYISITTLLLLGGIAVTAGWPYTKLLFDHLQIYINLYFYALNLAIG